jgi:hypothetical protein
MIKNIFTLLLMILYKVVYLTGSDNGYYLHKRKTAWFLLFIPILFYRTFINLFLEIGNIFKEIYSYNKRWVSVYPKPKNKLSFKQKKDLTKRLMS